MIISFIIYIKKYSPILKGISSIIGIMFFYILIYIINCNSIEDLKPSISTINSDNDQRLLLSSNQKYLAVVPGTSQNNSVLDYNINLWTTDGKPFLELVGHENTIKETYFLKDNKTLISLDRSLNLILWDLNSGNIKLKKELGFISKIFEISDTEFGAIVIDTPNLDPNKINIKSLKIYVIDSNGNILSTINDKILKDQVVYLSKKIKDDIVIVYINPSIIKIWNTEGVLKNTIELSSYDLQDICFEENNILVLDKNRSYIYNNKGILIYLNQENYLKGCHYKDLDEIKKCDFENRIKEGFNYDIINPQLSGFILCDNIKKKETRISKENYPFSLPILFLKKLDQNNIISSEGNNIIKWNNKENVLYYKDSKIIRFLDFYKSNSFYYYISQDMDKIKSSEGLSHLIRVNIQSSKYDILNSINDGYIKWNINNLDTRDKFYFASFSRIKKSKINLFEYYNNRVKEYKYINNSNVEDLLTSNLILTQDFIYGNGKHILIANENNIKPLVLNAHNDDIKILSVDEEDKKFFYSVSFDKYIKKWDLDKCKINSNCQGLFNLAIPHHISFLTILDNLLYVGTDTGFIYILNKKGEIIYSRKVHDLKITSILSINNKIITSSLDKKIKVWRDLSKNIIESELQTIYFNSNIYNFIIKDNSIYLSSKDILSFIQIPKNSKKEYKIFIGDPPNLW